MGSFGDFAKKDKKKKKQAGAKNQTSVSTAPIFVLPKLHEKKKKSQD